MLSRVADSMYWMSRYLERAEHTARVMDVNINLTLEQDTEAPPLRRRELLLQSLNIDDMPADAFKDDDEMLWALTFAGEHIPSIAIHIARARENARQIREQISSEMWNHINELYLEINQAKMQRLYGIQPHSFFQYVKNGSHLFQGITDSTMNHNEGWHFIQVGRSIERTISVSTLLDVHMGHAKKLIQTSTLGTDAYFEWLGLLKSVTAFEAYTKVYQTDLRPQYVIEFLLFNAEFPHSARFCVELMVESLNAIAEATTLHKNSRLHRLVGRLQSALSYDDIGEILSSDLHTYLTDIKKQAAQIHEAIYETYIAYAVEATLR